MKKRLQREYLYRLIDKYKKRLKLTDIAINVVIAEDKVQQFRRRGRKKVISDCYAEVVEEVGLGREYTIFFFKSAFKEDLEDTVIHELAHIVLSPLRIHTEFLIESMEVTKKEKLKLYERFDKQEHLIVDNIIKMVRDKRKRKA